MAEAATAVTHPGTCPGTETRGRRELSTEKKKKKMHHLKMESCVSFCEIKHKEVREEPGYTGDLAKKKKKSGSWTIKRLKEIKHLK